MKVNSQNKNIIQDSLIEVKSGNFHIGDNYYTKKESSFTKILSFETKEIKIQNDIIKRENEIKAIYENIKKNNILVLYGENGIGKSTIAQLFLDTYKSKFNYIGWFDYEIDLNFTFANQYTFDFIYSDSKTKSLVKIAKIIATKIHDLEGRKLIIIDNVTNIKDVIENKKILELQNCNVMLTSDKAIDIFHNYKIESLSDSDLLQLVKKSKILLTNKYLRKLFETIDNNSFVLNLIIKNIPKKRIEDSKSFIVDLLENNSSKSDKNETIIEFIWNLMSASKLDIAEIWLLIQFVALPETYFSKKYLNEFLDIEIDNSIESCAGFVRFKSQISKSKKQSFISKIFNNSKIKTNNIEFILNNLSNKGWLSIKYAKNETSYSIHNLTSTVLKNQYILQPEYFSEIFDTYYHYFFNEDITSESFKNNLSYIQLIESILSLFNSNSYDDSLLILYDKLIKTYGYFGYFEKEILERRYYTELYERNATNKDFLVFSANELAWCEVKNNPRLHMSKETHKIKSETMLNTFYINNEQIRNTHLKHPIYTFYRFFIVTINEKKWLKENAAVTVFTTRYYEIIKELENYGEINNYIYAYSCYQFAKYNIKLKKTKITTKYINISIDIFENYLPNLKEEYDLAIELRNEII